jgi:hypothetical protein
MARNKIHDSQLDTISTADKVALTALNIDGGTLLSGALVAADLFIVDDGAGGTNKSVTADTMQAYFSKVDLAAGGDASHRLILSAVADGADDVDLKFDGDLLYDPSGDGTLTISGKLVIPSIEPSGAFDLDAAGAITIDGASITLGGDADTAFDFDTSTFDIDSSGLISIDGAAGISIDSTSTSVAANLSHVGAAGVDLTIDASASSLNLLGGEADAAAVRIQADNAAGGIDVDAGTSGITIDTTGAFSVDGAAASNITVASAEADENLTLSVTGATASSLILSSAGTGTDAVDINATAGGIDIDAAGALAMTAVGVAIDSGAGEIDITTTGALDLNSAAATWDSSAGISLDAATASNFTTAAGDLDLSAAAELDLDGATVKLDSAGQMDITAAAALNLISAAYDVNASGVVGIDSDAAMTLGGSTIAATADGGALSLTTTDDAGDISLVSGHVAGVAIHLDGNANAGSIVDIDAGILDIDVTAAATIDAVGVAIGAGSGQLGLTTTGAMDLNSAAFTLDASTVSIDGSGALNVDTSDTSGGITIGTATSGVPVSIGNSTSEVSIGQNLTVAGNLTINGATTTVSTTNMVVEDKFIELGNGVSGTPSGDAGFVIERGSSDNAAVIWDESADEFFLGTGTVTGASDGNLSLTAADLQIAGLTATTVAGSTGTFSGVLKTDDTTDASSKTDGSLQTDGGLSVAKKAYIGTGLTVEAGGAHLTAGRMTIDDVTDATSKTDGSLQTDGGLSVAKAIYSGTAATLAADSGVVTMGAATALTVSAAGLLSVNNATEATTATDGSLQTDGGLSVVKSAVIGDDLDLLSDGAILSFGASQDIKMTHEDTSSTSLGTDLKSSAGASSINDTTLSTSSSSLQFFALGSDVKDNESEVDFPSFQTSRLTNSSLSSSTSNLTFSPEVGTSIAAGTKIKFTTSGGNTLTFSFNSTVSSGDTSASVTNTAGSDVFAPSSISQTKKLLSSFKSALETGHNSSGYSTSTSSLQFDTADHASAFQTAVGAGATVRFASSSSSIDFALGSYSSGTSITISSATQVSGSSVSHSGLSSIKAKSTSNSAAAAAASTFAAAVGANSGAVKLRFAESSRTIDFTFSTYSSGTSLSITAQDSVSGSGDLTVATMVSSGSIKVVTSSASHELNVTETFDIADHNGSTIGLKLNNTLVTASAAELNFVDGVSAGAVVASKAAMHNSAGSLLVSDNAYVGAIGDVDMLQFDAGSEINVASDLDFVIQKTGGLQLADGAVTSTAAELNFVDGVSAGSVVASKAAMHNSAGSLLVSDNAYVGAIGDVDMLQFDAGSEINVASDLDFNIAKTSGLQLGGTAVTSTAAELNIMDGDTTASSSALVAADQLVVNDDGTMAQFTMTQLATLLSGAGLTQSGASLSINHVRDSYIQATATSGNTVCTLSAEPVSEAGVDVYLNGVLQVPAGTQTPGDPTAVDYTYAGSEGSRTVTFADALLTADVVTIKYIAKSE